MVDFKMVDINGQYRHVTIPAQNFSEETMKSGIGFDASNYGYAVVEKSDMVFIPDPDNVKIRPYPRNEGMVFFYTQIQYLRGFRALFKDFKSTKMREK